jgi:hypothetical protein
MKGTWKVLVILLALAAFAAPLMAQTETYPQSTTTTDQQMQQSTTSSDPATESATSPTTTESELPATASPLPLVAMAGLMALAGGAWVSRPRARA